MEFTIYRLQTEADYAFFREEEYQSARENGVVLTDRSVEEARLTFLNDLDEYIKRLVHNQVFLAKTSAGDYAGMIWLAQRTNKEPWDFSNLPGWIYNIRVRPENRGMGLGRALLTKAEEWARECGFPLIGLHVYGSNSVAINLYHLHGFSEKYSFMQKDITAENIHPADGKIKFRNYFPDQDHRFLYQLLFSQYQAIALATASPTEEQIITGFEKSLVTYNFGNHRKEIIIAEDNKGFPIGALWFYKSKGDLGKRRYIWLHSVQATDPVHLPHLLTHLDHWAVQHDLDAIRTPVHQIENQLSEMLAAFDYHPADLFMFKCLESNERSIR